MEEFILDVLSLRYHFDIQLEMLNKQSDLQLWGLGERSELKIPI